MFIDFEGFTYSYDLYEECINFEPCSVDMRVGGIGGGVIGSYNSLDNTPVPL